MKELPANFYLFTKKLLALENEFTPITLKSKYATNLIKFYELLAFIEKKNPNAKNKDILYKKNDSFKLLMPVNSKNALELILSIRIIHLGLLSENNYNGANIRAVFRSCSTLVNQLLFNCGFLQKLKHKYVYSPLFYHFFNCSTQEQDLFVDKIGSFGQMPEQRLYLTALRSIRLSPEYAVISFDHGISLKTSWIETLWNRNSSHKKKISLEELTDTNKDTIIFEGDRTTRTERGYVTIFPK